MTEPLPRRPEPVAKAGAVAGAVAALILAAGGLLRLLGWMSDDLDVDAIATHVSDLVLAGFAVWAVVAPLLLALRARAHVTPLADPRDHDGTPLAPDSPTKLGAIAVRLLEVAQEHTGDTMPVDIDALRREYRLDE